MTLLRLVATAALFFALSGPIAAQPAGPTIIVWSFGFAPRPIQLAAGRESLGKGGVHGAIVAGTIRAWPRR